MKQLTQCISLALLFLCLQSKAQVYEAPSGINYTCTGIYTDSGGTNGNYNSSENITSTFCSNDGSNIEFVFTVFSIESGWEFLNIYDGTDNTGPSLGSWTGSTLPSGIQSTSGCITFVFTSDGSVTDDGWVATIQCMNPPIQGGGTFNACGGVFTDSGYLENNYGPNESNITTICSDLGEQVNVNFNAFDTEAGMDIMSIYDGNDISAPLIGEYSGTNSPGLVSSTDSCITFVFNSNAAVENEGWQANISCGDLIIPGSNTTTCYGVFYDSGGVQGDYSNNENSITTVCPDTPEECITVNFTHLNLENPFDVINVYDGNDINAPLLESYTGNNTQSTTSSTGCLTLEFSSDGSVVMSGWEAYFNCYPCGSNVCTGTTPVCTSGIPDNCIDICSLGPLPELLSCPQGASTINTFCLSNIGATYDNNTPHLAGCTNNLSDSGPVADVWYAFEAVGNEVNIAVNGLTEPRISIYAGDCGQLIGKECGEGLGAVNINMQTFVGNTYYLQISGGDINDQAEFELEIESSMICSNCLNNADITANPSPDTNHQYLPGETVEFCVTLNWNQVAVNWLHAVVPVYGNGWDSNSLTPTVVPPACASDGQWGWYNTIQGINTTSVNPGPVGPGFAFESPLGNFGNQMDNDPGNNFGDSGDTSICNPEAQWTFCWELTTKGCYADPTETDLSVSFMSFGDSQTGSYNSSGCGNDPDYPTSIIASLNDDSWNECPCSPPMNISHQLEYPSRCHIQWDAHPIADRYDVLYRVQGTQQWTRTGALNNYKTLHFLLPNTWYEYKVRTFCGDTWDFANASPIRRFNTGNIPTDIMREAALEAVEIKTIASVELYPNPTKDYLNIELVSKENVEVAIHIYNIQGQRIQSEIKDLTSGNQAIQVNVNDLDNGSYILNLEFNGERHVESFVKVE